MSAWIDRIVREFPSELSRFWIACDPDLVLLDTHVLQALRERGFELLSFEDSIAFRAEYEDRFRSAWDQGLQAPADALILHLASNGSDQLPWDYQRQARFVRLGLADIFQKLSYPALRDIGPEHYERLFEAHQAHATQVLGDAATKDFILTHVFKMAPILIDDETAFWRELLRLHLRGEVLPASLADRIAATLKAKSSFAQLPVKRLFEDMAYALRAIQGSWRNYLTIAGVSLAEMKVGTSSVEDQFVIPFDHPDIRMGIDTLFLEGALTPVQCASLPTDFPTWARVGIAKDSSGQAHFVAENATNIAESLPDLDASHRDWFALARRLGELLHQYFGLPADLADAVAQDVRQAQDAADDRLQDWLRRHFADLPSLAAANGPVMLHHVPRYLTYRRGKGCARQALLLFDGLSIDQWCQLRRRLTERLATIEIEEGACFAWLPSLTSVSRQTVFSGLKPREFTSSIDTTSKEPSLWAKFWQEAGLRKNEVAYLKGIKHRDQLQTVEQLVANPAIKVAGIVVDMVDEIVHGATLGKRGIASQIENWCDTGFVEQLIEFLINQGFEIHLTSDHGNVDAVGIGRLNQGVLSELRGERVRIYRSDDLAASVPEDLETVRFDLPGLPTDFLPVYPKGRGAFTGAGDQIVAHGGMSVEELIVPFIRISSKSLNDEK